MGNAISAIIGAVEIVAGIIVDLVSYGTASPLGNMLIAMGAAQLLTYGVTLLLDPRKSPLVPIGAAYAGWEVHLQQDRLNLPAERPPGNPARADLPSFERACRVHASADGVMKLYPRFRGADSLVGPFQTVGSCMFPYIRHGNLVWADRSLDVRTAEIVLARDRRNDKVFCKVLERRDERHVLTCSNEPEVLPAHRFEIIGPVVAAAWRPESGSQPSAGLPMSFIQTTN